MTEKIDIAQYRAEVKAVEEKYRRIYAEAEQRRIEREVRAAENELDELDLAAYRRSKALFEDRNTLRSERRRRRRRVSFGVWGSISGGTLSLVCAGVVLVVHNELAEAALIATLGAHQFMLAWTIDQWNKALERR
jgi:hypothetical protein